MVERSLWKSYCVASVVVVVSDRVVVAASVFDDAAIVEDGGEVLWKSILLLHQ